MRTKFLCIILISTLNTACLPVGENNRASKIIIFKKKKHHTASIFFPIRVSIRLELYIYYHV